MPITHIPKFPIVDPDPSLGKAISNFHLSDWLTVAAFAGSGYTYGFFAASKPLRSYNSKVLFTLGITAGLMYGVQNSTQRFIGLRSNDDEIRRFGVASDDRLERFKKHTENPNLELIDSEISKP